MKLYKKYVIGTLIYGLIFILGLIGIIYFSVIKNIILAIICILISCISLDNFFCSSRLKSRSYKIKTHYTIPLFLKKK